MKVLIVCSDFPLPANHGGRVDVLRKIQLFINFGCSVDVLVSTKETSTEDLHEIGVSNVFFSERYGGVKAFFKLFSLKPFQVATRDRLQEFSGGEYDLLLLEGDYVMDVLKSKVRYRKSILRVHNDEALYAKALMHASTSFAKKIFYYIESLKFKKMQRGSRSRFDRLWFISDKELRFSKNSNYYPKSIVFPTPIKLIGKKSHNDDGFILYVGNLFSENNLHGLKWFLDGYQSKGKLYNVVVTGNAKHGIPDFLNNYGGWLKIIPSPSDLELDSIMKNASVFVNPIFFGAGVKIKTIEALRYGIPLVSTDVGVEGLNIKNSVHFMLENSIDGFVANVDRLYADKALSEMISSQATKYLESEFDSNKILLAELENLGFLNEKKH